MMKKIEMRITEKESVTLVFAGIISAIIIIAGVFAYSTGVAEASVGPNVAAHTQAEIRAKANGRKVVMSEPVTYSVKPDGKAPYNIGTMSGSSLTNGINLINNIRYVAGLNDNVQLDTDLTKKAQAAAFISGVNGSLSHIDPTRPAKMSEAMYSLCTEGTSSTNLGLGYDNLCRSIIGWTEDSDNSNVGSVGHRRWLLNPAMGKTGLGYALKGSAMYAFDTSGTGKQTRVAWPAQQTPIDYICETRQTSHYGGDMPYAWSVSTGKAESASSVKVTLKRTTDGRTWTFSSGNNPNSVNSGAFHVNNQGYGMKGCIIFRPNKLEMKSQDKYHVTITGAKDGTIEYDVELFSLVPVSKITFPSLDMEDVYLGDSIDVSVKISPSNASEQRVEYSSSDTGVIRIDKCFGDATIVGAGTAKITASVDGKVATKSITIPKAELDDTFFRFMCGGEKHYSDGNVKCAYDGKAKRPALNVTYYPPGCARDARKLKEGRDYKAEYSSNTNIGRAKIVVTGTGNYTGRHTLYFKIVPKKVALKKVKAGKNKVSVSFGKVKGNVKYQVVVKQKGKKAKKYNVKGNCVIKRLSAGKTSVKVRAYKKVNGKKYYSNWSNIKKVRVK